MCGNDGNEALFRSSSRSGEVRIATCGLSDGGITGAILRIADSNQKSF